MRVVVTGDGGHIGGAIKRHLIDTGWEVVGMSRTGEPSWDIGADDFTEKIGPLIGSADAIVHCAAALGRQLTDSEISRVNGIGTQNIIEAAAKLGAGRLVYLSSLPVIGRAQYLPIDEDHPVNPATAYHASKLYGEHLMRLACGPQLSTVSLRLTSPIGPHTPRGRIFSTFVQNAMSGVPLTLMGKGGRGQNYVDVRDIASAVRQCLASTTTGVCNIGGTTTVSNHDLARACIEVIGSKSVIQFSGTPDPAEAELWDVSIEKARQSFGYEPKFGLTDSIESAAISYASGDTQ